MNLEEALRMLQDYSWFPSSPKQISFECTVTTPATEEEITPPGRYCLLKVQNKKIKATFQVWGDYPNRDNIELAKILKPGDVIKIIKPRKPKSTHWYKNIDFWVHESDSQLKLIQHSKNTSISKYFHRAWTSLKTFIGQRLGFGIISQAARGEIVRSKAEKQIADFLFNSNIDYEYEPILKLGKKAVKPDFYLSDYNCYLEYWGLLSVPDYAEKMRQKIKLYHAYDIKVISLYQDELFDIEKYLTKKLSL